MKLSVTIIMRLFICCRLAIERLGFKRVYKKKDKDWKRGE